MSIEERLTTEPGSYLLWYFLSRGQDIEVGRLGPQFFRRGWYAYCGSAFGPGGLRGRLRHHLGETAKPHWHIDYFKAYASLRKLWLCAGINMEHDWSRMLVEELGGELPCHGFGASDCQCRSHFVYFPSQLSIRAASSAISNINKIKRYRCHSL